MKIHPSAIIGPKVELGKDVAVGPGAVIEGAIKIGDSTEIGPYVVVTGNVSIGRESRIFTGAVIGSPPQDLKYRGQKSFVRIGERNTIREYVTINPATGESEETSIGSDNLIMAYSHIAHNCTVGDKTVLANNATLSGHVTIENNAVFGGLVGIHQFCRVGSFAIVGGCSKVCQDILPYSMADGHPARIYWLNRIGLKRNNFSPEAIASLEKAFRFLLRGRLNLTHAVEKIKTEVPATPEITLLLKFIAGSERGIAISRKSGK
jgi:UDP-N-acetylglucosamine acyltransferase